jgi:hypothetical protein
MSALIVPLLFLSFRPVEEIDSINYLHYLIEWMANRATPYTFATNYVAFWELSFLPSWIFTGVDWFFPILALKAVALLALALWLLGRELGLSGPILGWTIFGALVMRHYWFQYSGVPTLKNDALHGVGFVLLALVAVRAATRALSASDYALLALAAAFAMVKYTGIFAAVLAGAAVVILQRRNLRPAVWLAVGAFAMLTSGHYYLHNWFAYGSPFYPFQINLGPIHLPGTADLSDTSILYSLGDARVWRLFLLPAGGLSPAGLLFPVILATVLPLAVWRAVRPGPAAIRVVAICLLCGWLLYFRSVYSASAMAGNLGFLLNGLNSLRYVDGVLAASELFLVAQLPATLAGALVGVNLASRLWILYPQVAGVSVALVTAVAAVVFLAAWGMSSRPVGVAAAALLGLIVGAPFLVERNRTQWTTYWNDVKPALSQVRSQGLAELALEDAGYFMGHVVAAGNPVNPAVRSLLPEDMDALSRGNRPKYLAVLVPPGSIDWRARYGERIARWGYRTIVGGRNGAVLDRQELP